MSRYYRTFSTGSVTGYLGEGDASKKKPIGFAPWPDPDKPKRKPRQKKEAKDQTDA